VQDIVNDHRVRILIDRYRSCCMGHIQVAYSGLYAAFRYGFLNPVRDWYEFCPVLRAYIECHNLCSIEVCPCLNSMKSSEVGLNAADQK
jgi:hypothetical protein